LYRNVCDETGAVRRHLNIFVNSDNVRDLDGVDTTLMPGDVVTILPAVSGG
jgi:molybdopterin converting factor small subunit